MHQTRGIDVKKPLAFVTSLAVALAGCATAPKDIPTTYVSPLQYQAFDCDQIAAETQRVQVRVQELGGRLDEASSNDKVITTVGVVLFWPILFALGGTKQQESEFGRLKGEYEALQQAAISKKCPGAVPTAGTTAQAGGTQPGSPQPANAQTSTFVGTPVNAPAPPQPTPKL